MTVTTALLIYVMLWVVVLFLVLPWGVHPPGTIEEGHALGAPDKPRIALKLLITSVISGILWAGAYSILAP